MTIGRRAKLSLRTVALLYLLALLILPVVVVFFKTFEHGFGVAWGWMTTPAAISALTLSLLMALIAVPLNTIFGVTCALVLVRRRGRMAAVLDALIDLPFLVSPIIVGLALTLVYGIHGWFGGWFNDHGIRIIFAPAGMVLATVFVSLPLVARAVLPVLEQVGMDQDHAAASLGANAFTRFRRVTLPTIRVALAYGVVLALARCIGEYGAVLVISGNISGQTQTAPLLIGDDFQTFQQDQGYAIAFVLVLIALAAILIGAYIRRRQKRGT